MFQFRIIISSKHANQKKLKNHKYVERIIWEGDDINEIREIQRQLKRAIRLGNFGIYDLSRQKYIDFKFYKERKKIEKEEEKHEEPVSEVLAQKPEENV